MRRYALLLLVVIPYAGLAQSEARRALEPVYKRLNELTGRRDSKGLASLLKSTVSPDFKYIGSDGTALNVTTLLTSMRQQLAIVTRFTRNRYRIEKVASKGSANAFTVSNDIAMVITTPDKKTHTASSVSTTVDTWIKSSGKWKLREVRVVKEKNLFDGKPVAG